MNDNYNRVKSNKLRKRAEEFLNKTPSAIKKMPSKHLKDLKILVEELQIHQVELEIQNEELRRTEGKLEAERKKYSDLYDFAPVGYLTFSDQQMILEANLTAAAMLGVERGSLVETPFRKYISIGDQDTFYLYCRKLVESKDKQTCNLRLLRKNGADFRAQMECNPVFDENGKLDLIRAIVIDITKQHRAAKMQRESDARYRALFENMKDGVCIYEARNEGDDFVFIDFNKAAEKIENIPKDALMGKSVLEVFPAVKEFGLYDVLKRVWKTGEPEKHPVSMYQDERIAGWRENFVCKLPSGEIVAVYSDETDRRQAEDALKRSEEKFRTVANFTYDWEYWVAPDGHALYVSPSCERITGYGSEAFLNDPRLLAKLVHPDDQQAFADHVHQIRQLKQASPIDFRILTRGGEVRWISHACQPVYGSEGQYLGQRASNRDISKRKRMGEALQQSQKMEAIATLTGGIAHDYNNLMSIIMGNLSLAQEEAEPGSVLADFLNEANMASLKVRDLTHELMSLSRGGAPVKEVGSLAQLLKDASGIIPAGISLNESISQNLWPVAYDPHQMGAVFRNVLTNAVEAMPQGGALTVKTENLRIEDEARVSALPVESGDYVRISIQDQGKGIPKENLDKIFDPYFSTKALGVQKGMGLGLATAYAIVKKHGGHIAISSSPGVGTTVNIYLPAENQTVEIDLKTSSPDESALPMKRVLVMDDEEMLRKLARQMLERMGYAVETVKDGVEAIEACKRQKDSGEPFGAVILDLTIKGGMGGEQTIRELLKIDPGIKAIVSSGYFNDPVMSDFEKYGFMGAIAKPYDKKTLKEVLERLSE